MTKEKVPMADGSIDAMSEPRLFQQITVTVDIWAPRGSDFDIHTVADNVQISACNAVEAAVKEIALPEQGLEVVVR